MDSDRRSGRVRLLTDSIWRQPCRLSLTDPQAPTAIRTDLGAIFVSLELSRSTWLITSLSPGGGEKMSKHTVRSGDVAGLRTRFAQLKDKVQVRMGQVVPIIVIQEAGLDGFWIHRLLRDEGVESHIVDPASIATSRRRRRAKTDKIDGEARCERCWRISEASRGCAPWFEHRRRMRRIAAGSVASARPRQRSGWSTSIGSRGCSSPRASLTMSHCCAKDGRGLRNSGPVMVCAFKCSGSAATLRPGSASFLGSRMPKR